MPYYPQDIVQFVHVLGTTVSEKTKRVMAQVGSVVGKGQAYADNIEWIQHPGILSRPPKAVTGKTATAAVVLRVGNREIAIGSFEERGLGNAGSLAEGETCIYAAGPDGSSQGRILLKKDGGINIYSRKGNEADGGGMVIQLDASGNAIRLLNADGYGIIIDEDGVKITAKDAALTLGSDGAISLVGTGKCQLDGSSICLGSTAAPGVNSVCVGVAGLVAVGSPKVFAAVA